MHFNFFLHSFSFLNITDPQGNAKQNHTITSPLTDWLVSRRQEVAHASKEVQKRESGIIVFLFYVFIFSLYKHTVSILRLQTTFYNLSSLHIWSMFCTCYEINKCFFCLFSRNEGCRRKALVQRGKKKTKFFAW